MSNMKPYEYTGKIHQIGKTETYPSGFMKRTCVLINNEDSKYPEKVAFDFFKFKNAATDLTSVLNNFIEGQMVTVKFYPESRESTKKPGQWFSQFKAIAIEKADRTAEVQMKNETKPAANETVNYDDASDDMPF